MTYNIDIQYACADSIPVSDDDIEKWATLPLKIERKRAELTLRFVDKEEMTQLNHAYRQKNKPTNVLAFPMTLPDDVANEYPLLGDVIICPAVLKQESQSLNKSINEHWAHIVIHGVLHLLGYDHIEEQDALEMQTIEIKLLAKLGFDNPYQAEENEIE